MSALAISLIVLVIVCAGALLGLFLQYFLPDDHMSAETQAVVKLGTGLIATLSALVLGLLVASEKTTYDTQNSEIQQIAANVLLLDRVLGHYGADAAAARDVLRQIVAAAIETIWHRGEPSVHAVQLAANPAAGEALFDQIQTLGPQDDVHRALQSQALQLTSDLARARYLLFEQRSGSYTLPFLTVLVFWLAIIFATFALFAPRNATVIAVLLLCAISVSGAVYLILELDTPFQGLLQISDAPLRNALSHIGR